MFRRIEAPAATPERRPRKGARVAYCVFRARDGFEVAFAEAVIDCALALARRVAPNETMGLLYGKKYEDDDGIHVVIHGLVPNLRVRMVSGKGMATAHSEWETRKLGEDLWSGWSLRGWFHTHAGVGARYSPIDRETQRQWTDPSMVGLLVDPMRGPHTGVYRGPDAELLEEVHPAPVPESSPRPPSTTAACALRRSVARWAPRLVVAVGMSAVAALAGWALHQTQAVTTRVRALESRLETQGDAGPQHQSESTTAACARRPEPQP